MASTSNNCTQQEGEITSKDRGSNGRSGHGSGSGIVRMRTGRERGSGNGVPPSVGVPPAAGVSGMTCKKRGSGIVRGSGIGICIGCWSRGI